MISFSELLDRYFNAAMSFFAFKKWMCIGVDRDNGSIVVVPNTDVINIRTGVSPTTGNGLFTMYQGYEENADKFIQFQFHDLKEIERMADALMQLRINMVIQRERNMDFSVMTADDIPEYEPEETYMDIEEKYMVEVCGMKTETGEIVHLKSIAALAKHIGMIPATLQKRLNDCVMLEVVPGWQVRYYCDIDTFIPKDIYAMVRHQANNEKLEMEREARRDKEARIKERLLAKERKKKNKGEVQNQPYLRLVEAQVESKNP